MDTMLTLMQIAALAVAGMCHALLGSIKVPLARKLKIDEARVGGLVSVFGFTLIPMCWPRAFWWIPLASRPCCPADLCCWWSAW